MFGISLFEFLIIALVFFALVRPADIPSIIRAYKTLLSKVSDLRKECNDFIAEFQSEKSSEESNYVIDLEGKVQKTYDIEEIKRETVKKKGKIKG